MNAINDAARVLGLIRQAGSLGATASELAGWTGKTLTGIETHLRTLRRQGLITRTKVTRSTGNGTDSPVYQEKGA
jgi:DNA-binding IclR family transcriptional regulator